MSLPSLILAARDFGLPEVNALADACEAQAAQLATLPAEASDAALRQRLSGYRLTPRQMDVALLLARAIAATGTVPTMQEMGDAMGMSKVCVFEHVTEMVRKGVLTKVACRSRALRFAEGVLTGKDGQRERAESNRRTTECVA